eukprot:7754321-Pyramimonas_sp.AAC.1
MPAVPWTTVTDSGRSERPALRTPYAAVHVLCCAVMCCAVLCCAVLCCAALCKKEREGRRRR